MATGLLETVIIIGSGPAGYTAAIYAARGNLAPILFEGEQPGGQLTTTSDVENYPGYSEGVMGPKMMEDFKKQAERFGTKIFQEIVTSVDFTKRPFTVSTDKQTLQAKSIIISTGASAKRLGLENETKLFGKGVSACATCDAFFFKNKTVVVVGGGDSAMEESTYLTKFASKVYLIHRSGEFRASKIMLERAQKNPKIEFVMNTQVVDILGVQEGHVTGVVLKNLKTEEQTNLSCDGFFAAIGHEPNTKIFAGQIELDQKGYIVCSPGSTATSVEGVFAGGDCVDHRYRQAVTAAGMGCAAAIDAERWLEAQE